MGRIQFQDIAAVTLALVLASPPLWWAGESLGAARQIVSNEIGRPADIVSAPMEWAWLPRR